MLKNNLPTRLEAAVLACFKHERNLTIEEKIKLEIQDAPSKNNSQRFGQVSFGMNVYG